MAPPTSPLFAFELARCGVVCVRIGCIGILARIDPRRVCLLKDSEGPSQFTLDFVLFKL
jgi:hypothetical protein